MPASKLNYIVVYKNHSQVYGSSTSKIAVESPPPEGLTEQDKNIFFVSFEPDSDNICLYKYKEPVISEYDVEDKVNQSKKVNKKEKK